MPPRAVPTAKQAAAVFARHGLGPPGFWGSSGIPTDENRPYGSAIELCAALAELGGLYGAFARFLGWRADLLDASYLTQLRRLKVDLPAIPPAAVAAIVRRELEAAAAEELARTLSPEPLWNTRSRTAYAATWRREPVIVQVAHPPVAEATFQDFEKGIRALGLPELAGIIAPSVLEQFRDTLRSGESLEAERSFLDVLSHYRGDTLAEYPAPIPELSTPAVLCWPAAEGRPVSELLEQGDGRAPVLIASAILEQFFSLSMVDADLTLESMLVDRDHRLHVRRLNHPIAVLPGVIDTGIKYVSAVLAGNAPRSAQTLIRLMIAQPPLDLEKELMEEFSGVEPELKINLWYPPSAGAFESNWRALARIAPRRPLFLDCLHRNLVAAGYWNADAVGAGAPAQDAILEAMWPVVGQLLRTQTGVLWTRESAQEWAAGSGLLMVSTFREMNRLVEELRDNDLTVGVDAGDWPRPEPRPGRPGSGLILGGLLLLFLVSLQGSSVAPEPWAMVLKVLGVVALPAMFWAASRVE